METYQLPDVYNMTEQLFFIQDVEYDIHMVETLFGYRLFHKTDSAELEHRDHRYPFCDIFIMKQSSG